MTQPGLAVMVFSTSPTNYRISVPVPDWRDRSYDLSPSGRRRDAQGKERAWEQDVRSRWRVLLVIKAKLELAALWKSASTFSFSFRRAQLMFRLTLDPISLADLYVLRSDNGNQRRQPVWCGMTSPPGSDLGPFASLAEDLQEITVALAATTTEREVIEIVLTPAVEALGAVAGIVLLVDHTDQQLKIAGSQGYEDLTLTVWQEGPVEDHVLIADILRMGEARYFEYAGALKEAYPDLESRTGGLVAVANATLPMFLDKNPLGVIVLDFKEPHHFTPAERRFLTILSGQCAVALGRAAATRTLEARVEERTRQLEERTRQLEEERAAQDAFVSFTEAVGSETDLPPLIHQAITVLQGRFPGASAVYYEEENTLWKGRFWSDNLRSELVEVITAGLSSETPIFNEVIQTKRAVFTDEWDAQREGVASSEDYNAAANYPLLIGGELHWLLSIGLRETHTWSEADRALFRAVGRSLNLALERTETARQLAQQNAELQAHSRALEAFADLTRDLALTTDPLLLIRRAQEVVLSMLPDGSAMYFVPEGDRWHNRVQYDTLHSAGLQAAVDAGLPYTEPSSLVIPWTTGQPYFQDVYDRDSDRLASVVGHVSATAALPLRVGGELTGVLAFALLNHRTWSSVDRVVLKTVVQSLELALDRARHTGMVTAQRDALEVQTQALAAQKQQLEESTRELEAFSYSVSHDLRTPVRHMIGFLQLARKSLEGQLDDRSRRYLDVVGQAGEQMNTLIDALLNLSRAAQQTLHPRVVNLDELLTQIQITLLPDLLTRNVQWEVSSLPRVHGDWDALNQVLTQLTENALKFTHGRDPAIIRVWAEDQGDTWKISVGDNGLGFDPRYQDRLFNLFQRLHTAQEAKGTGVGLASIRRLILKHGGQVFGTRAPPSASPFPRVFLSITGQMILDPCSHSLNHI